MKFSVRILVAFLSALCAFSAAFAAGAVGDAALLDALVAKDFITEDEAFEIKKEQAEVILDVPDSVAGMRLYGFLHMRYSYVGHDVVGLAGESRFNIRRFSTVMKIDTSENSELMACMTMPSACPFDTLYWAAEFDGDIISGKFKFGFSAVNFVVEDIDSASIIKGIDRSILCPYFGGGDSGYDGYIKTAYGSALGFAGKHLGLRWNGDIPGLNGFVYSLGLTNSKPRDYNYRYDNGISCWLGAGYETKREDWSLRFISNFGYADKIVSAVEESAPLPAPMSGFGDTFGVNTYLLFDCGDFELQSEFMLASVKYGASRSSDRPYYTSKSPTAVPWGVYVMGSYKLLKFDGIGEFEPVLRYTYLDTDGRGVRGKDVVYGMDSEGLYDRACAYYAGINWYVNGKYLKYSLGWERFEFFDKPLGGNARSVSDAVIVQIQMFF